MEMKAVLFLIIFVKVRYFALNMKPFKSRRVAFQTFVLEDRVETETIQCYGRCNDKEFHGGMTKFNYTRCDGNIARLVCSLGHQIKIVVATVGQLDPKLDICSDRNRLVCANKVSSIVQRSCNHFHVCTIKINESLLTRKCSNINYIAMDIEYRCEIISRPKHLSTEIVLNRTTPNGVTVVSKRYSTRTDTINISSSYGQIFTTSTMVTTLQFANVRNMDNGTTTDLGSHEDMNMFWSLSAYTMISDLEFMKKHETHLALALLLSMFVGAVLFVGFLLDFCRRVKKKREKEMKAFITGSLVKKPNKRTPNIKSAGSTAVNGNLLKHGSVPCCDRDLHAGNCNLDRDGEVYEQPFQPPFSNLNSKRKLTTYNDLVSKEDTSFSVSSPIPPPLEFSVDPRSMCSSELLSPPFGFDRSNSHVSYILNKNSTRRESQAGTPKSKKIYSRDNCNIDMGNIKEIDLDMKVNNQEEHKYDIPGNVVSGTLNHDNVDYSSITIIPSDINPVATRRQYKDSIQQGSTLNRKLEFRKTRSIKCTSSDTCLHMYDLKDIHDLQNANSNNTLHDRITLDKTNKHFMVNLDNCLEHNAHQKGNNKLQRSNDATESKICRENSKIRNKDLYKKKMQCNAEFTDGARHHVRMISHCRNHTACHKFEGVCRNCDLQFTPKCQPTRCNNFSHNEVAEKKLKGEKYHIEESGYQSRGTDTDYLCSSTPPTDHGDSSISSPVSVNSALGRRQKAKHYHTIDKISKQNPRLISVRDCNKSNALCRTRPRNYTNIGAPGHDKHTSTDIQHYPASVDFTSSADSVKVITRHKTKTKVVSISHPDENTNCSHH